jgi:hypothetical protein
MKTLLVLIFGFLSCSLNAQDMQKYLAETRTLIQEGKNEEALKRCIWFHNHALEYQESMTGVRLSFALSDWKKLGDQYPPALAALKEIRDQKTKKIIDSADNPNLFQDVASINRTLYNNDKTVSLFKSLSEVKPQFAKDCWIFAKPYLFESKSYDIIKKYIGNPMLEFNSIKERFFLLNKIPESITTGRDRLKVNFSNNFVNESINLIQFSVAVKDIKSAKEIQKMALAVVDDYRLKNIL